MCTLSGRDCKQYGESFECSSVVSCSCDFPRMQFWVILSLASWCQSHLNADVPLHFSLYFLKTWLSPNHLKLWPVVCPCFAKILLLRLFSLVSIASFIFQSNFHPERKKKGGSVFWWFCWYFIGRNLQKGFLKPLQWQQTVWEVFKCNGKIRDSWGRGFQGICTEKNVQTVEKAALSTRVTILVYLHMTLLSQELRLQRFWVADSRQMQNN